MVVAVWAMEESKALTEGHVDDRSGLCSLRNDVVDSPAKTGQHLGG